MQSLVAKCDGNLGASAALNPKRMQVGRSANRRCRGGKILMSLHHEAVKRSLAFHISPLPRADAPPPHHLEGVVLPPRELEALNPKP